jgi:hypothetical protein
MALRNSAAGTASDYFVALQNFRTLPQLELYLLPTTYNICRRTDVFIDITKVPVIPS